MIGELQPKGLRLHPAKRRLRGNELMLSSRSDFGFVAPLGRISA